MSLELDPGLLPPIETQSLERKLLDGLCWKDMSCISPICYIVLLEYQADVVTQLKVQESSRLLFIYLVSKLDIRCIYSLVCKGINSIPSQTNVQLCFYGKCCYEYSFLLLLILFVSLIVSVLILSNVSLGILFLSSVSIRPR